MRLLTKMAKENTWVKDYVNEKMYFEAYIHVARECDTCYHEIIADLEKEMQLKNPKITNDDYASIECELMDLMRDGELPEGDVLQYYDF